MNLLRIATDWLLISLALRLAPDEVPEQERQHRDHCAEYLRLRFRLGTLRLGLFLLGRRPG